MYSRLAPRSSRYLAMPLPDGCWHADTKGDSILCKDTGSASTDGERGGGGIAGGALGTTIIRRLRNKRNTSGEGSRCACTHPTPCHWQPTKSSHGMPITCVQHETAWASPGQKGAQSGPKQVQVQGALPRPKSPLPLPNPTSPLNWAPPTLSGWSRSTNSDPSQISFTLSKSQLQQASHNVGGGGGAGASSAVPAGVVIWVRGCKFLNFQRCSSMVGAVTRALCRYMVVWGLAGYQ
jgi:hypothetical protein